MAFNSVGRAPDKVRVARVLVSAYDKTGLAGFARGIAEASPGCVFYSTGGSYDVLSRALDPDGDCTLVAVSEYTGQPEMAGGLVKTLDWRIYLGLLAEPGDARHDADLERVGAVAFDMVVCNLYPFAAAAADPSSSPEDLRQRIDIGGPCMIRAASKNFLRVAALSSPAQYDGVLEELRGNEGRIGLATRWRLAMEAFALTSEFDRAIAARLGLLDTARLSSAYGLE